MLNRPEGPAQEAPRTVGQALDHIGNQIDALEGQLEELTARLMPISNAPSTKLTDPASAPGRPTPIQSPLLSQMNLQIGRLGYISERVAALLRTIEL